MYKKCAFLAPFSGFLEVFGALFWSKSLVSAKIEKKCVFCKKKCAIFDIKSGNFTFFVKIC